jgi:hypothetical protein
MDGGRLGFAASAVLASIVLVSAAVAQPGAKPATTPIDTEACLKLNEKLYAWAEAQEKKDKKLIIPREFARVSANLEEYCNDKEFEKARISIDWMNTCIENYRKPYKLGFCQRTEKYFCAIAPGSDGCAKK